MKRILILEDNEDRRREMLRLLDEHDRSIEINLTPIAADAIRYYREHHAEIIVIALDHDLEDLMGNDGGKIDPGTGRDVSDFLSQQTPTCPIIIHSTNRLAVDGMELDLTEASWSVERIAPYGDLEWIPQAWMPAIRRELGTPDPSS